MSTHPFDRKIEKSDENPESYMQDVKSFLDSCCKTLPDAIRNWALMKVYSETSDDDYAEYFTAMALMLRIHIADVAANEAMVSPEDFWPGIQQDDEVVMRERLLSVGMQMQVALDTEQRKYRHMKVDDVAFFRAAVECDFQTHLIEKKTGLSRRTVQVRKKELGLTKCAE